MQYSIHQVDQHQFVNTNQKGGRTLKFIVVEHHITGINKPSTSGSLEATKSFAIWLEVVVEYLPPRF
jgi:hypothetical protein